MQENIMMSDKIGGFLVFIVVVLIIVGVTFLGIMYDKPGDIVAGHTG